MLDLSAAWCWDFWLAQDAGSHHLFYLTADKSLGDPEQRHLNVRVGHAVSEDLRAWRPLPDAIRPGPDGAPDDAATWTGSVVRHPGGGWRMFYTCGHRNGDDIEQSVGYADSPDLIRWTKAATNPVLGSVAPYEPYRPGTRGNDFRDPWVFRDPGTGGWHMLITTRAATGSSDDRGVIGHATSADLDEWHLQPPLSLPGNGFSQLEVMQCEVIDGRAVLMFSCLPSDLSTARRATTPRSGTWIAHGVTRLGPWDLANAYPITDETLYSGKLVSDPATDQWSVIAFVNRNGSGAFGGTITDPMPIQWTGDHLSLLGSNTP